MKMPKFQHTAVSYWLAQAATELINGFIAGLGGGSVVGVGTGATMATTDLGSGLSPIKQITIAVASLLMSALGNGLKRVIVWHDQHPFPNPWPDPSGGTNELSPTRPPSP